MRKINYIILVLFIAGIGSASAQLNPMGAQFYLNQYLGNAAFAGVDSGLNLSIGFRKQLASLPGSPENQTITGEYRFGRVGLGLNVNNDKAGLIRKNRTVATYSYHLPIDNNNRQLHFGVSMGFLSERIAEQDIVGDPGDVTVGNLNRREVYMDGDFGMAYTTNRITIQAAIPNMRSLFYKEFRNFSNQATFLSAISYRMRIGQNANNVSFEPKLSFRGVKGMNSMWDLGANIGVLNNALSAFAMYHNTENVTVGFSALTLKNTLTFQAIYTTETAILRGDTNGNFELSLKYRVF